MFNLFGLLMIAFILLVFVIALLAIGWLIKSKTKIEGTGGRPPLHPQEERQYSDGES